MLLARRSNLGFNSASSGRPSTSQLPSPLTSNLESVERERRNALPLDFRIALVARGPFLCHGGHQSNLAPAHNTQGRDQLDAANGGPESLPLHGEARCRR